MSQYTVTEQKILDVLSDGQPHSQEELHACLWDDQGSLANIRPHITHIRQKLRPLGQDIICEYIDRRRLYRHVRLLHSANDGYR